MPTYLPPNQTPTFLQAELDRLVDARPTGLTIEEISRRVDYIQLRAAQQEEHERFYRLPENQANFKYWARRAWNNPEGTGLSLGLEPRRIEWGHFRPFLSVWPMAREYDDRANLLTELFPGPVGVPVQADQFIIQADQLGIEFPAELITEVAKVHPDSAQQLYDIRERTTANGDAAHLLKIKRLEDEIRRLKKAGGGTSTGKARETSQLALDYALAIKFRFKLDERNAAVTNIKSLLDDRGVPIHRDTIYDRLAAAVRAFGPVKLDE